MVSTCAAANRGNIKIARTTLNNLSVVFISASLLVLKLLMGHRVRPGSQDSLKSATWKDRRLPRKRKSPPAPTHNRKESCENDTSLVPRASFARDSFWGTRNNCFVDGILRGILYPRRCKRKASRAPACWCIAHPLLLERERVHHRLSANWRLGRNDLFSKHVREFKRVRP